MQEIRLKEFKNAYCDTLGCSLGEFLDVHEMDETQVLKYLNDDQLKTLTEYAVLKNKTAGVGELFLKVPKLGLTREFDQHYQITIKEIISANDIDNLTTRDMVGDKVIIEVENLLEYNEGYLSKIVDFAASTDTPVLVKMGQTLEEVGKIVNKYNCSPAQLLEDYGFLDRRCLVHGLNFLDKEDQKLLTKYNSTLVFSPRDDGEIGRGAINLYNFIFNDLKFVFSSGKCYNIDMLGEGKLARVNTANLMYERGLVGVDEILNALQGERGELLFFMDDEERKENLLDKTISPFLPAQKERCLALREEVLKIVKELKEKL